MSQHEQRFVIKTKNYVQSCFKCSPNCIYFERQHWWRQDSTQIDTFSEFWSVALFSVENDQLALLSGDKVVTIQSNKLVYIPPFSIVRWQIKQSFLKWQAYLIKNLPAQPLFQGVAIFDFNRKFFENEQEISDFLNQANSETKFRSDIKVSVVAARMKQWIDKNFKRPIRFSDYAKTSLLSLSYLTKEFKACYGINPLQYLNKLRTYSGMFYLLTNGNEIGQTSFEVGYKNPSNFYKNFTKEFLINPYEYKYNDTSI